MSAKKELLVKKPTEISEVLRVNDKTRYMDNAGKRIDLTDLPPATWGYIRTAQTGSGKVAVTIRKEPMTIEELHRRYVK